MIVVNGKMNWRQALIEFLEPKGFFVQKNTKDNLVFGYKNSKVTFKRERNCIVCNRVRYSKLEDGELTFYEDLYIQECDNNEARKTNKKRLESALATKVMMFELALKHEISEALPEVENIEVNINSNFYRVRLHFKSFCLSFFDSLTQLKFLEVLVESDLFNISVVKEIMYKDKQNGVSYEKIRGHTTLQEFIDKIHTEDFQVVMEEFRQAIDENRKQTLQEEIKDLEKSIQWRKSELAKMQTDEKNLIYKIF